MDRLLVLCALLIFITVGCTGRHVVVDPDKVSGLDSGKWIISKEPSQNIDQQKLKEMRRQ